jgi:serine protease
MANRPVFLGEIAALAFLTLSPQFTAAMEPEAATPESRRAQKEASERVDSIIVKYRQDRLDLRTATVQSRQQVSNDLGARVGIPLQHDHLAGVNSQVLKLAQPVDLARARTLAAQIATHPDVEYAEPNTIMQIQQSDPLFPLQWHYDDPVGGINLPAAWAVRTNHRAVVAVIDSGVRAHEDLAANLLPGYDFIRDPKTAGDGDGMDPDPTDAGDACPPAEPRSTWHGLHVAGTVAAVTNNNKGVAGVAPQVRIVPVRVLGKCGGTLQDIADGMLWAAGLLPLGMSEIQRNKNPAQVLNLSLGAPVPCGRTYADVISLIRSRNVTIVVAAGNGKADASTATPANCNGVISVAATNRSGGRAYYSNFGSVVKIAAPGGEIDEARNNGILSTYNGGAVAPGADEYGFKQGTSMAAPHVAAVVAMLYARNPKMTPNLALEIIQKSARPFPTVSTRQCDTKTCGAGILDAGAALRLVDGGKAETSGQ